MTFIRRLLGLKPRTQAELDAFIERNRIDMAWRHQKQVHKELKAHHRQEYVDRHKKRGKLRQVYFRQEANKTILYNSAGFAIAELSVPTYRPSTLTSTNPDAQRLDAQTNLASDNIESAATQGINNSLISDLTHGRASASQTLEEQDSSQNQAPEILSDPASSAVEPSADQLNSLSPPGPAQGTCDMSHEREVREAVPLMCRDSGGPIPLSHADQVSRPTTPDSGNPANCSNAILSVLSLEPESSNSPGADASRTENPPEQSMTHYQGAWSDGPTNALSMSDLSCEGFGTSNQPGGEITVSEFPPTIPDAFDTFSAAPFHPVDVGMNMVEQATFRVPIQTQHRNFPCITSIGSSANSSIAREANAQLVTIASTSHHQPPTGLPIPHHLQSLGQSAGPSQDPKGKGKAEAEPEAVSSIGFSSASCYPLTTSATYTTETELIHNPNPRCARDWHDFSIKTCCYLLLINNKAYDNCWVCERLQYAISWMTMAFFFTKSL